ncbi:hypothetical protein D9M69_546940 [compost metagenome]
MDSGSVDAVVTSPPYCTRLDYARTTMPELLVLETLGLSVYKDVRNRLMGASTVRRGNSDLLRSQWGGECNRFLEKIYLHPSKASKTYYFDSHLAYFDDLYRSVVEISRVLRSGARACVVVQDSYYKDVHNDVPKIFSEMAKGTGLSVVKEFRYQKKKSMCSINSASSAYRGRRSPTESALLFIKE